MTQKCDSGDAAAYALGALEGEDLDRFRQHLLACAVCRDEVAALSPVASLLATAVPQHPAPRGLQRRLMAQVRQEERARVRARRVPGWRLLAPAMASAFALVVGLVLGVGVLAPSAPSNQVIRGQVIGSPRGSAVLHRYGPRTVLNVDHLPPPPPGDIYEIWEREGTQAQPTDALFSVTSAGSATAVVPGDLKGVNTVMVTAEPAGGTSTPTTAPVIVVSL